MADQTYYQVKKAIRLIRAQGGSEPGRMSFVVDVANGNDGNEGSRENPLATIQEAVDQIESSDGYGQVVIMPGSYPENVVVSESNIIFSGVNRGGVGKTEIVPATGIGMVLGSGQCQLHDLKIESKDDHAIMATGEGFVFDHLVVETNADNVYGIWLDDADRAIITRCLVEGNNCEDVIGILVGDSTTRTLIDGCTIQDWGSGITDGGAKNGYGIGLHGASQNTVIASLLSQLDPWTGPNNIIENYIGVYVYAASAAQMHSIFGNVYSMNSSYDNYDSNTHDSAANLIRGNFYAYNSLGVPWYRDADHDGQAETIVNCGSVYDPCPLSNPESWRFFSGPRLI